jgi:hypothetical protein
MWHTNRWEGETKKIKMLHCSQFQHKIVNQARYQQLPQSFCFLACLTLRHSDGSSQLAYNSLHSIISPSRWLRPGAVRELRKRSSAIESRCKATASEDRGLCVLLLQWPLKPNSVRLSDYIPKTCPKSPIELPKKLWNIITSYFICLCSNVSKPRSLWTMHMTEVCRFLGCGAMWVLLEPMFQRNVLHPSWGWKEWVG